MTNLTSLDLYSKNNKQNLEEEILGLTIDISVLNGNNIDLDMMNIMHNFYAQHCSKWGVWGSKYLTREFFEQIIDQDLRSNIVLFITVKVFKPSKSNFTSPAFSEAYMSN